MLILNREGFSFSLLFKGSVMWLYCYYKYIKITLCHFIFICYIIFIIYSWSFPGIKEFRTRSSQKRTTTNRPMPGWSNHQEASPPRDPILGSTKSQSQSLENELGLCFPQRETLAISWALQHLEDGEWEAERSSAPGLSLPRPLPNAWGLGIRSEVWEEKARTPHS